jgi:hypothetical protein
MAMLKITISAHQVDNLIKAYSKQGKAGLRFEIPQTAGQESKYSDVVILSNTEHVRAEACKKISYSLLEALLKERK